MKSKKFRVAAIVILAVIIGVAIGWFAFRPGVSSLVDIKIVPVAKADESKAVAQAAPVAQVELPKAAAVGANGGKVDSPAEDVALARAELKATAQDMARTMRDKGRLTWMLDYYPPDFTSKQSPDLVQRMLDADAEKAEDPQEQLTRENLAQKYDYLATLTPTLNATGDKATYYGQAGDKNAYYNGSAYVLARFAKINGKWYWVSYLGDDPSDPYP